MTTSTEFQYLEVVATKMDMFSDYYSSTGTKMVATSSFTIDLANKLRIADDYKELVVIFSPVELTVTDSMGGTTGVVDGVVKEEIPDSVYSPETKALAIFFANASYTYTLKGVGEGTYGLLIEHPHDSSKLTIYAPAVPVQVGEVHTDTVDWDGVKRGNKGVVVGIDKKGDGVVDEEVVTDASLTDITLFTAPAPSGGVGRILPPTEDTQARCTDGIDNEGDGTTELADDDCRAFRPQTLSVRVMMVTYSKGGFLLSFASSATYPIGKSQTWTRG